MLQVFGLISGLFAVLEFIPYIRDILKLRARPQRATFLIWGMLGSIAFFSQLSKGASYSLFLPGFETLGTIFIFLLTIKYGVGGFSKRDYVTLFIAIVGLIIWYFTKEAAVALYITILVDMAGNYLTIHKTYLDPKSETNMFWILAALSGFFAALAVGSFNVILLSYPVYIVFANLAVVVAIRMGLSRKLRK